MPVLGRLSCLALTLTALAGCSDSDRPPGAGLLPPIPPPQEAGLLDVGLNDAEPPPPDAEGLCGNHFFEVIPEPPNMYFVLDRSGSMTDPSGVGGSKWSAVRNGCVELVAELGDTVNVGAAVFPKVNSTECTAGAEVFATRAGDPKGSSPSPVTSGFAYAINVVADGGTPTAQTLRALRPILSALQGKTSIILATDGGPNCNDDLACNADECIWNIEEAYVGSNACTPTFNCCAPSMVGPGPRGCLDAAATLSAVQSLRDAGIRTFVVGIPGSAPYAALLEQLAVIGGSARPQQPRYYRVDDLTGLGDVLRAISLQVLVTCDFVLNQAPPDPNLVNVYVDKTVVPYDPEDGWTWTSDTTLSLNGEACAALIEGRVRQVQVTAGCPTKQPL